MFKLVNDYICLRRFIKTHVLSNKSLVIQSYAYSLADSTDRGMSERVDVDERVVD